jgi:hypothetical protein
MFHGAIVDRDLSRAPGPGYGWTYTSGRPDSFDEYASQRPSGDISGCCKAASARLELRPRRRRSLSESLTKLSKNRALFALLCDGPRSRSPRPRVPGVRAVPTVWYTFYT